MSVPTLDRLTARGELRPVRIGQLVRFDVQDLRSAYLDSAKVKLVR